MSISKNIILPALAFLCISYLFVFVSEECHITLFALRWLWCPVLLWTIPSTVILLCRKPDVGCRIMAVLYFLSSWIWGYRGRLFSNFVSSTDNGEKTYLQTGHWLIRVQSLMAVPLFSFFESSASFPRTLIIGIKATWNPSLAVELRRTWETIGNGQQLRVLRFPFCLLGHGLFLSPRVHALYLELPIGSCPIAWPSFLMGIICPR